MTPSILDVNVSEKVCRLTLNRPKKRNALNGELISALSDELNYAAEDEDVSVIAIMGSGKDFCAGADLAELERVTNLGHEASVADAMTMGELFIQMRRHSKPIIAIVHGRALAGGCGLATACDMVLARDDAEFGYPEINLGFVPAMVMAILLRKVTESVAFELVTTGEIISAQKSKKFGLVNRVFSTADFESGTSDFLNMIANKPGSALALSKELLYRMEESVFEELIAKGAEVNAIARQTKECRDGVRQFLDRSQG
tara:strand:+ start:2415 stop:3185 length:771 start_codon:yes stop_codon:yes gene_type:complete